MVPVPWEKCSPRTAHVITPPTFSWRTQVSACSCLKTGQFAKHNFSAARVRRARAPASSGVDGAGKTVRVLRSVDGGMGKGGSSHVT